VRQSIHSINPATGEVLASYEELSDGGLDARLALAETHARSWRAATYEQRGAKLRAVAGLLRRDTEALANLMAREMGKPIREARAEVDKCAWVSEFYAENAGLMLSPETVPTDAQRSFVCFEPLGAVLGVMPWNFPFWQAFRFAAPTLMAGNVVLLKHAENTTGCALAIERIFGDAGLPGGVFNTLVVRRDRVEAIIRDRRVAAVSLTGSVGAGRAVAAAAGAALKPCVLELGGSDPCIVLADAEFDRAVAGSVTGRMVNGGQSCIADKRFIVEAPIYERFLQAMSGRMEALVVGDPLEESTQVGPLARRDLVDALATQVRGSVAGGARCLLGGGPRRGRGAFYQPTVLADVVPGMPAFDEETFGPVAAVSRAVDGDAAVELANRSLFGLGASLWTTASRGEGLAARLEAGHVAVNGIVKSDPRLPFGGIKESGFGRELGRYGLLSFVNVKAVWIGR
jgi:acyl-CoA reductase-like NAD-dependent aldehyde dehydrogenase